MLCTELRERYGLTNLVALVAELLIVDQPVSRRQSVTVYQHSQLLLREPDAAGVHGPNERRFVYLYRRVAGARGN